MKNPVHIVFSTKDRESLIYPPFEEQLYKYLGGICSNLECQPIEVGGYRDHVHILCMLSKHFAMVDLLRVLKTNSSKWIKTLDSQFKNFRWQEGYGAFSITPTEVQVVRNYVRTQHKHHQGISFKEEYLGFLHRYNVDYDERYVWD